MTDSRTFFETGLREQGYHRLLDVHYDFKRRGLRMVGKRPRERWRRLIAEYHERWWRACLESGCHIQPFWSIDDRTGLVRDAYRDFFRYFIEYAGKPRLVEWSPESDLKRASRGTHNVSPQAVSNELMEARGVRAREPKTRHGSREEAREWRRRHRSRDANPVTAAVSADALGSMGRGASRHASQMLNESMRAHGSWEEPEPTVGYPYGRARLGLIVHGWGAPFGMAEATMSERQRVVMWLYFFDGFNEDEIAHKLRMHQGRVSEMIGRIRKTFRRHGLPDPKHVTDGREGVAWVGGLDAGAI
jgi:hypothetical protein